MSGGGLKAEVNPEDATNLEFGEVFSDVFGEDNVAIPMITSEVMLVLEMRKKDEESGGTGMGDGEGISETFQKTLQYCQRFGQFRDLAKVQAVRALLQDSGLHPFEQAALANLCPADAEEAAALLPSLTKRLKRTGTNTGATVPDEVELGELIENIQSFRNFRDV
eukprot:m.63086 g.63086  ORF g.63086 m.63086 type:complete len:165 (-) comp17750_c0_seq1:311-805(-)